MKFILDSRFLAPGEGIDFLIFAIFKVYMQQMKIKYAERRIKNNLGYGILMTGLGLVMGVLAIKDNDSLWISAMWLLFGLVQTGIALYEKKHQYLTIDENKLTKHSLLPKTIEIHEIKKVWKFVNSYKIETSNKTITIDKNVIQEESLYQLADYLNSLTLNIQSDPT